MSLFQQICIAAYHVSKNDLYNAEKMASFTGRMTPPYSKTSVFVDLQENDKRAFKKTHFGTGFENLRF